MEKVHFRGCNVKLQECGLEIWKIENCLGETSDLESSSFLIDEVQTCEVGLHVLLDGNHALIEYGRTVEFYRGLGLLRQWRLEQKEKMEVRETPVFEHLTYMVDCSRNAVCGIPFLKELIEKLAWMGYDRLMLYTEDTYEVEGYPFFGYFRGRYSKDELRMLDRFAASFGIELVPCIQTLAHMNGLFRWKDFEAVHDTGDILCCGREETYDLIEGMVKTYAETLTSRIMNIGMDEAEMLGRGKYLQQFGYKERFDIMEGHLKRVLAICGKYGFRCMMWSDMFFKMLNGDRYYDEGIALNQEVRSRIPKELELVYWDYYARSEEKYKGMMERHKQLTDHVGFAGGAWKWNGFAPLMNHSMEASVYALEQCRINRMQNVIVTSWGDDGGEASQWTVLPVLSLYAEFQYAQRVESDYLSGRLQACTGTSQNDFLALDMLNLTPDNPLPGRISVGPAKYLLYQDVLLGFYDCHIDKTSYSQHYENCARELMTIASKAGTYSYIFETLARLSDVLAVKAALGIQMKEAYDSRDKTALTELVMQCRKTVALVERFHECLRFQWLKENKPFGLEVQDIRIGGLKQRLLCAAERVEAFVQGRISVIEELEQERLLLDNRENAGYKTLPLCDNEWRKMVTPGIL